MVDCVDDGDGDGGGVWIGGDAVTDEDGAREVDGATEEKGTEVEAEADGVADKVTDGVDKVVGAAGIEGSGSSGPMVMSGLACRSASSSGKSSSDTASVTS